MENILIPTDFSNNAYNAISYAAQLLRGKTCTFHLLNVYDELTDLLSPSPGKDLLQQLQEESHEGLLHSCHRVRLDDTDMRHTFKMLSKKGDLVTHIRKSISELKIDMVVMGNKGCSEIKAIFIGSNTLKVIEVIQECPILTVPKEIDFKEPNEIAFATDFTHLYDAGLLHPLIETAKQFSANIRVMHISEEEELTQAQAINKDILMQYLSPFQSTIHWMPLYKSKAGVIRDFLQELHIDLLAMVHYEHSLFESLTNEPVINRVAFDQDIPFLIIPSLN